MKKFPLFITYCLAFCLSFFLTNAFSEATLVPKSELTPAKKHKDATEVIIHIINSYHYRTKPIDNTLSSSIFDNYLESLDPNHSFFLNEDIQNISKYRDKLDDALLKSELEPAFDIFKTYRQRVKERIEYAVSELEKEFDFEIDEEYLFDRRELTWANNVEELNEIWRKRVKNDMLNLLLTTGKEKTEIKDTLRKRYQRIYTSTFQLDSDDIFQTFINAYTTSIEPHTAYFSPRTSENFDIGMRLSLEGIGAVLRNENDYTLIQKIIPGGPADLSKKLHAKDKIIGVGQGESGEIIDVIGWRLDDVVELIRGPKDTVLRLEIIPGKTGVEDLSKILTLTRNKIKLEGSAAKAKMIDLPELDKKIGVIDIPTFYVDFAAQAKGEPDFRSTSTDVQKLVTDLVKEDVEGIIIDLRGNGGGSLSEALALTGLFIEEGPIVQTRDASGKIDINVDPDPSLFYAGPLAVLVDRNSASASEIFAGAIQDYQRGIIIGEPTYGKGTVQNIVDLNRFIKNSEDDHGKLKTTIAQFFRISGGSTQNKGIIPDIVFPTAIDIEDYGERSLDNALPWDKVEPARYIKVSSPVKYYGKVRSLHKNRIKSDRAFKLLLEQLALVKKSNKKKTTSLKESKRKAERDQLLDMKHELVNELRVVQGLKPLPKRDKTQEIDEFEEGDVEDKPHDVLLQETARILYDLIVIQDATATELQALKIEQPQAISNM
ncbi:MAG: carboxy terminal-processing peptidase [Proteobacteria bacterium]|nr:carboxy terminal-processing peptidase [Pseudomonadota bacterium]